MEYDTVIKRVQQHALWPKGVEYSFEEYCWAKTVISTRAFHLRVGNKEMLHLVPFVDLANSTQDSNVDIVCNDKIQACNLISNRTINAGEQIYVCYDHRISFVNVFERYGYLDLGCKSHTVEMPYPAPVVQTLASADTPVWKRALLRHVLGGGEGNGAGAEVEAMGEGDGRTTSLWLTGLNCPLMLALRVCTMEVEQNPTKAVAGAGERRALEILLTVIEHKLAQYPPPHQHQPDDGSKNGSGSVAGVDSGSTNTNLAISIAEEVTQWAIGAQPISVNCSNARKLVQYEVTILLQKRQEVVELLR